MFDFRKIPILPLLLMAKTALGAASPTYTPTVTPTATATITASATPTFTSTSTVSWVPWTSFTATPTRTNTPLATMTPITKLSHCDIVAGNVDMGWFTYSGQPANTMYVSPFESTGGPATSMGVYLPQVSPGTTARLLVYEGVSTTALVTYTAIFDPVPGWNRVATTNLVMPAGTVWLAVVTDTPVGVGAAWGFSDAAYAATLGSFWTIPSTLPAMNLLGNNAINIAVELCNGGSVTPTDTPTSTITPGISASSPSATPTMTATPTISWAASPWASPTTTPLTQLSSCDLLAGDSYFDWWWHTGDYPNTVFVAPYEATAGVMTSMGVDLRNVTTGSKARMAVYQGISPTTLVYDTGEFDAVEGWNQVSTPSVNIGQGTVWLAVMVDKIISIGGRWMQGQEVYSTVFPSFDAFPGSLADLGLYSTNTALTIALEQCPVPGSPTASPTISTTPSSTPTSTIVQSPTPLVPLPNPIYMEDFEDGDGKNLACRNNLISVDGHGSTIALDQQAPGSTIPGGSPARAAHFYGSLTSTGVASLQPFGWFGSYFPEIFDFDGMNSITFSYKAGPDSVGKPHAVILKDRLGLDYGYYMYPFVPVDTNWHQVRAHLPGRGTGPFNGTGGLFWEPCVTVPAGNEIARSCLSLQAPNQDWETYKTKTDVILFTVLSNNTQAVPFDLTIDDIYFDALNGGFACPTATMTPTISPTHTATPTITDALTPFLSATTTPLTDLSGCNIVAGEANKGWFTYNGEPANTVYTSRFDVNGIGMATSMGVYLENVLPGTKARMAAYTGDAADTLLYQTVEFDAANGWNRVPVGLWYLPVGGSVWLAVITDQPVSVGHRWVGPQQAYKVTLGGFGNFPASLPATTLAGGDAIVIALENCIYSTGTTTHTASPTATPTVTGWAWGTPTATPTITASPTITPAPGEMGDPIICTFELPGLYTRWGGSIMPGQGGGSTIILYDADGCPYGTLIRSQSCSGTVISDCNGCGAWVDYHFVSGNGGVNLAQFPGGFLNFSFLNKTPGVTYRVSLLSDAVTDGDYYQWEFTPGGGWQDFSCGFPGFGGGLYPEFTQRGTGAIVDWADVYGNCKGIRIEVVGSSSGPVNFDFQIEDIDCGYPRHPLSPSEVSSRLGVPLEYVTYLRDLGLDDQFRWLILLITKKCGCHPSEILLQRNTKTWIEICQGYGEDWWDLWGQVDGTCGGWPTLNVWDYDRRLEEGGKPCPTPQPTQEPTVIATATPTPHPCGCTPAEMTLTATYAVTPVATATVTADACSCSPEEMTQTATHAVTPDLTSTATATPTDTPQAVETDTATPSATLTATPTQTVETVNTEVPTPDPSATETPDLAGKHCPASIERIMVAPNPMQAHGDRMVSVKLGCGADKVTVRIFSVAGTLLFEWVDTSKHVIRGQWVHERYPHDVQLANGTYHVQVIVEKGDLMDSATTSFVVLN